MITATDPLADAPLDWTLKGVPSRLLGLRTREVAQAKVHLFSGETSFPVATLSLSALTHNSRWMRQFLDATGAKLCPHGKTTMAPALFARQLQDGAWGITAATLHHVRAYRQFGVSRILLANQIMDASGLAWLLQECRADPNFEVYSLTDSAEHARWLAAHVRAVAPPGAPPLRLLLEIGRAGGRTGARTLAAAMETARAVAENADALALSGVETFEGVFQTSPERLEAAEQMVAGVVAAARAAAQAGLFSGPRLILSAGGSGFYDLAARMLGQHGLDRELDVIVRSGCYLTHDDGMYAPLFEELAARDPAAQALGAGLQPALTVWAPVQSLPEPGLAICALGKRDVGHDAHLPRPKWRVAAGETKPSALHGGAHVIGLNDQHAFVQVAQSNLALGDIIGFGVSHPCTTFDKWRAMLVVNDDYQVVDIVRTYF